MDNLKNLEVLQRQFLDWASECSRKNDDVLASQFREQAEILKVYLSEQYQGD